MILQEYSSHKPFSLFGRKVSPFPKSIMNLSRVTDEPTLLNLSIFTKKSIDDISFGHHMMHDLDYNFSTWSFSNIFTLGPRHNYTKYYIDGYSKSPMILARELGEKLMFPLSIYAKIKEDKSDDK